MVDDITDAVDTCSVVSFGVNNMTSCVVAVDDAGAAGGALVWLASVVADVLGDVSEEAVGGTVSG